MLQERTQNNTVVHSERIKSIGDVTRCPATVTSWIPRVAEQH